MAQTEYAYDLFITYADADRAWVEGYLLDALTGAGIRCHSESAFELGVPRILEFERAVRQSKHTVLVLSSAFLSGPYEEFAAILAQSVDLDHNTWSVIPIRRDDTALPPRLAMLVSLDASDPAKWSQVVERICGVCATDNPPAPVKLPCPYPGLGAFSQQNADLFFGRDLQIQELQSLLHVHPFAAIIGRSGCGKSSLVFAGLIPALRSSTLYGSGEWAVADMRPGENPLDALGRVLGGDAHDLANTVAAFLSKHPNASRILLVVDQFEELFTPSCIQLVQFQKALLELIHLPNCYVVLTVRADFYDELYTSLLWHEIKPHLYDVLPLDEKELREAIDRPARSVRVFIEPTLVERLVADADVAHQPGILPFVQETMVLLWEGVQRRYLAPKTYQDLGLRRVQGQPDNHKHTGLQMALALSAEESFNSLSPQCQFIARRIFLSLVQFGEGRADTRRQQSVSVLRLVTENREQFDQTMAHLTKSRLLTLSGQENDSDRKVDLAHESLIVGWTRFANWIAEYKQAELELRRLQVRAREWRRMDRLGGYLDAVELRLVLDWLHSKDAKDLGIDANVREFISASELRVRALRRAQWRRPLVTGILVIVLIVVGVLVYRETLRQRAILASPQISIEGGITMIGVTDEDKNQHGEYKILDLSDVTPAWQVKIPSFKIDRHEVTNEQYCLCRQAGNCAGGPENVCQENPLFPVTRLTLRQANDFCAWIGRRLATEFEWEWVARGKERRLYPIGNTTPYSGQVHVDFERRGKLDAPLPITDTSTDRTPQGVIGMTGNVREWTLSPYLKYDDPRYRGTFWQPSFTESQWYIARGGGFESDVLSALGTDRYPVQASNASPAIGFRCLEGVSVTELPGR